MQLHNFKTTIRGVIDRGVYDDGQRSLFQPSKIVHDRFSALGIKGKQPAPRFAINLTSQFKTEIENQLIKLGHKLSGQKLADFKAKKICIKPNSLALKGRVGWDSNLKGLGVPTSTNDIKPLHDISRHQNSIGGGTGRLKRVHGDVPLSIQANFMKSQGPTNGIALLTCPKCKACELSSNKAINYHDFDKACKCKSCKTTSKARNWMCKCQIPWHLCSVHSSCCSTTKKQKQSVPTTPCKGTKRIGPFTHEQLVAIDHKRIRRGPAVILPPSSNILSVKLRERFAHLLNK